MRGEGVPNLWQSLALVSRLVEIWWRRLAVRGRFAAPWLTSRRLLEAIHQCAPPFRVAE